MGSVNSRWGGPFHKRTRTSHALPSSLALHSHTVTSLPLTHKWEWPRRRAVPLHQQASCGTRATNQDSE
eukprot:4535093-Prymnesium_polylepis.1